MQDRSGLRSASGTQCGAKKPPGQCGPLVCPALPALPSCASCHCDTCFLRAVLHKDWAWIRSSHGHWSSQEWRTGQAAPRGSRSAPSPTVLFFLTSLLASSSPHRFPPVEILLIKSQNCKESAKPIKPDSGFLIFLKMSPSASSPKPPHPTHPVQIEVRGVRLPPLCGKLVTSPFGDRCPAAQPFSRQQEA